MDNHILLLIGSTEHGLFVDEFPVDELYLAKKRGKATGRGFVVYEAVVFVNCMKLALGEKHIIGFKDSKK